MSFQSRTSELATLIFFFFFKCPLHFLLEAAPTLKTGQRCRVPNLPSFFLNKVAPSSLYLCSSFSSAPRARQSIILKAGHLSPHRPQKTSGLHSLIHQSGLRFQSNQRQSQSRVAESRSNVLFSALLLLLIFLLLLFKWSHHMYTVIYPSLENAHCYTCICAWGVGLMCHRHLQP